VIDGPVIFVKFLLTLAGKKCKLYLCSNAAQKDKNKHAWQLITVTNEQQEFNKQAARGL